MRIRLLTLALLIASPLLANAAESVCTVERATNQIQIAEIERRGRAAQVTLPILDELKQISTKARDSQRPVVDQLTARDAGRFAQLAAQLQQMRLSAYIDSGYARDAEVVQRMFAAAWKAYTNPAYTPADGDVPASLLFLARLLLPEQMPWAPPNGSECSVDTAIALEQQGEFRRVNALGPMIDRNSKIVGRLRARYGLNKNGKFDPSKMDPDDARALGAIQVEMQPHFQEGTLAHDLQHIRAWWAVADLIHRTRQEDVRVYASIEHIGDTLRSQQNDLTPDQKLLIGLWEKVDQRVRSQEQILVEQMAAAANGSPKKIP